MKCCGPDQERALTVRKCINMYYHISKPKGKKKNRVISSNAGKLFENKTQHLFANEKCFQHIWNQKKYWNKSVCFLGKITYK